MPFFERAAVKTYRWVRYPGSGDILLAALGALLLTISATVSAVLAGGTTSLDHTDGKSRRPDDVCVGGPNAQSVRLGNQIAPGVFETADGRRVGFADLRVLRPEAFEKLSQETVAVTPVATSPDRHGVLPVYVGTHTLPDGAAAAQPASLHLSLVRDGDAMIAPEQLPAGPSATRTFRSACLQQLLAAEQSAMETRSGAWAERPVVALNAANLDQLKRSAGTYVRVTGRPTRISRSKGRLYLNFGRRWREDMTAVVSQQFARTWPETARSYEKLGQRKVIVRGYLELRNGPLIRIAHPSALSVID